ncbi:hypothetical protein GOB93_05075 [Acetobacter musti]|uniref:SsuA/THI5-like domain-containing protein n=1 Tax=Acetobacter musti TaxID=864732 RepID=A0ABX0JM05_9PROT|nr:ABC transporter substrate-binding protein [Acetobacter musti]NHN84015.1 hypothetical protein [Acetobacter musti]
MTTSGKAITRGRRQILAGGVATLLATVTSPLCAAPSHTLRISAQESSILFQIARSRNLLVPSLHDSGFEIVWSTLGHSPAEMGQVDFLSDVAEAVPTFIHRFFPDLALYAAEGPSPHALGILTRKDRNITSLAALAGHSVAVAKSGSALDLLILSLQQTGLKLSDIHTVFLPEPGCLQAFRNGSVDAWATFDPFLTFGRALPEASVLTDGAAAGMHYNRYYMADRNFVRDNPQTIPLIRAGLRDAATWITGNREEAAKILSRQWQNMPDDIVSQVLRNRNFSVRAASQSDIAALEAIATRYTAAGILAPGSDMSTIPLIG